MKNSCPGIEPLAQEEVGAQSSICFNVDQGLYQLSLGTQIGFAASQRLRLHATPAFSLNILDLSVQRSETFMFADGSAAQQWSDSASELLLRFGIGITGGADYDLGKGWFAGVFGGYEFVPQDTEVQVGPNTVSFDPSGWVAGVQVGRQF